MTPRFAVLVALLVAGCGQGDPSRVLFFDVARGPAPATLDSAGVTLAEGTTVRASVSVLDDGDHPIDGELTLQSRDESVLLVEIGPGAFYFTGVSAGNTTVDVRLDGEHALTLTASVLTQEP